MPEMRLNLRIETQLSKFNLGSHKINSRPTQIRGFIIIIIFILFFSPPAQSL